MEINGTLIDYNRVYEAISSLKDVEKDKVIKEGLRNATRLFVTAGKRNLTARSKKTGKGNLIKYFRNKLKKYKLGALAGFSQKGRHSHLVDLGTVKRTTKKGQNRGTMPANKFWTDAIQANENKAIERVYEGIERGIHKLMMRN